MNNTILVPTDFSSNAWVAIEYAAQLGLDKKKKLVLLHAFNPFYSSFTSMEHNLQMLEETEKIVNAEMELISEKLKSQYPTLEFECLCLEGNLNEVIVRESKDNLFDLIVMGTKGGNRFGLCINGKQYL